MSRIRATVPVLCLALAACAGTGGLSPDGGLAFDVPSPANARYVIADTLMVTVNSPMGTMSVPQKSVMTLDLSFSRGAEGILVSGEVVDFAATSENPVQGNLSADESDLSGLLELTLGRTGDVEVVSIPDATGAADQLASFHSIAHGLFPRLPGRVVAAGDMWVDTVSWSGEEPAILMTQKIVYVSTVQGDTLVEGRSLVMISFTGEGMMTLDTNADGAQIKQKLEVTVTGTVLWDPQARLVFSSDAERELEGQLEIVGMGMPKMPVKAKGPVRVRLKP